MSSEKLQFLSENDFLAAPCIYLEFLLSIWRQVLVMLDSTCLYFHWSCFSVTRWHWAATKKSLKFCPSCRTWVCLYHLYTMNFIM